MKEIKINQIFQARQGEGLKTGLLTTFVRLAGCNLTCKRCEVPGAKTLGKLMPIEQVVETIKEFNLKEVCILGGEPLLQKQEVSELCNLLLQDRKSVLLETNGTIDWDGISPSVRISLNLKQPTSGMQKFNLYDLMAKLGEGDQIKLKIQTRQDYDWAINLLEISKPYLVTTVILQPVGGIYARNLFRWAEGEKRIRVMLQQNKVVGR